MRTSLIVGALLIAGALPAQAQDLASAGIGDINGDNRLDNADLRSFQQQRLGRAPLNMAVTDLNGDGMVDASDQQLCTRAVLGLPTPMRLDASQAFEGGVLRIVGAQLDPAAASVSIGGLLVSGALVNGTSVLDADGQSVRTGLTVDINGATRDGPVVISIGGQVFSFAGFAVVRTAALSLSVPAIREGAAGTTATVTGTVTLDRPALQARSFEVGLTGGADPNQATAGSDFEAGPLSVTIAAGDSSGTADIVINGDDLMELDETLMVTLDSATPMEGLRIDPSNDAAMLTIINDDGPAVLNLVINMTTLTESPTASVVGDVYLSAPTQRAFLYDLGTIDGTAVRNPGGDFTGFVPNPTTVGPQDPTLFPFVPGLGLRVGTFSIGITDDGLPEGPETFQVTISNVRLPDGSPVPEITLGVASVTITINDP